MRDYSYATAETIQDSLLTYLMGTRKLEAEESMFKRNLVEQARQFDKSQLQQKDMFSKTFGLDEKKFGFTKKSFDDQLKLEKDHFLKDMTYKLSALGQADKHFGRTMDLEEKQVDYNITDREEQQKIDRDAVDMQSSYYKQKSFLSDYERAKTDYINKNKDNWDALHKVAGAVGLSEFNNAEEYYANEFEQKHGHLRPEPTWKLPSGRLPSFGVQPGYFDQYNDPSNLLDYIKLGNYQGAGG